MGKKYLLIDNEGFLDYFMDNLKDEYIPIVMEYYFHTYLELKGIKSIAIYDYLNDAEINNLRCSVNLFVDDFLGKLDELNEAAYKRLFGHENVKLFSSITGYYFKSFIINCFLFVRGIELLIEKHNIEDLSYLHDGIENILCANRKQKSFIFPDDIQMRILHAWQNPKKIEIKVLKAPPRKFESIAGEKRVAHFIKTSMKNNLRHIKRSLINLFSRHLKKRKNVLVLTPFQDLLSVLMSAQIREKCNLITWYPDDNLLPELKKNTRKLLQDQMVQLALPSNIKETIELLSLNVENINASNPLKSFDFPLFITPLISSYLERKLLEVIRYWQVMEASHKLINIDVLIWGNPPLRYTSGAIREFARIHNIPTIGLQHGGLYGSSETMYYHFDTDYSKCDCYLSYGFTSADIKEQMSSGKKYPRIIPVGSTHTSKLNKIRENKSREEIDILYPLAVRGPFFASSQITPMNKLVNFQKQIINLLLKYPHKRIIISCPPNFNKNYPLKPYLQNLNLAGSNIKLIKDVSFTALLRKYKPKVILIEKNSTPLNEALLTDSIIVLYNDPIFKTLTKQALASLSKRALVFNAMNDYLESLKDLLNGKVFDLDFGNKEFLKKYFAYIGNPKENIEEAILGVLNN